MLDLKPVWEELGALIAVKWPEAADGYRGTDASRTNWRDDLVKGALTAPFVIIRAMPLEPYEELSITQHFWSLGLEIYYVRSATPSQAEITAGSLVEDDIEAKLLLLAEDLHHVDKTTYQVFEDFTIDVTDQNEVNQIVFGTGAPYMAGALKGSIVCWEPS